MLLSIIDYKGNNFFSVFNGKSIVWLSVVRFVLPWDYTKLSYVLFQVLVPFHSYCVQEQKCCQT